MNIFFEYLQFFDRHDNAAYGIPHIDLNHLFAVPVTGVFDFYCDIDTSVIVEII